MEEKGSEIRMNEEVWKTIARGRKRNKARTKKKGEMKSTKNIVACAFMSEEGKKNRLK